MEEYLITITIQQALNRPGKQSMNFSHLAAINLKHNENTGVRVKNSVYQPHILVVVRDNDPCGKGEGNSGDRHLAAQLMPGQSFE